MNMKKFLAVALSVVVVGGIATPTIVSHAEGLTQATNAEEVNYGTVTKDDITLLRGLFDLEYYMEANPDIVKLIGTDPEKLFEHFYKYGIFEGRTCNENFDPAAYASAYSDVREAFGLDIIRYYRHYVKVGLVENRTLTTVKACAEAGITVTTLSEQPVSITPAIYQLSEKLGTKDFKTIALAADRAYVEHKMAVVDTPSGTVVFSSSKDLEMLKGYKAVDTIKVGDSTLYYYVFKNTTGTAVYRQQHIDENSQAIFTTSDSVQVTDADYRTKISVNVTQYSDAIVDEITTVKNTVNGQATQSEALNDIYYKSGGDRDNPARYHYTAVNEQESGNIISVKDSPSAGVNGTSMNGNINSTLWYIDGTKDQSGNVTLLSEQPTTPLTDAYRDEVKAVTGLSGGQNGWIDVDPKGTADTEYTVCIGAETEGNVTDLTIGVYNEETGSYYWSSSHLVD
ncbi:hypothetical protein SAMN05421493_1192 [Pseudobutyrivibrio sp. 49]|uniref:hypothetical protein n=1 Tax=Pseudobutyrivibrio sp. 49 TaxID=1855344 RepID=UPI00088F1694|nr:hypothetical protein [Pseudobutyrivibrio sp. 49]SDI58530.1 hypothetical protein SAMN05421493_1192 [Pseudobutyrivibrio sp. 49]